MSKKFNTNNSYVATADKNSSNIKQRGLSFQEGFSNCYLFIGTKFFETSFHHIFPSFFSIVNVLMFEEKKS